MKYKTIKEFYDAVKSGELDETKLQIIVDSDTTLFIIDDQEITVQEANGRYDVEELYRILFDAAKVCHN